MYYSCGGSEAVRDGKIELTHRAQVSPHSGWSCLAMFEVRQSENELPASTHPP